MINANEDKQHERDKKDAEKWNALFIFYKMWKKGGNDKIFCDVFEEMNGGISALEEKLGDW